MALPRIDHILASDGEMQPVIAKAREINALAKLCKEFLPPELSGQLRPANFQSGKLIVLAANAAAAAKLRLLSESLGDFLSKRGAKVNSVSVKVQPGEVAASGRVAQRPAALSADTFLVLSELYESLSDSPARQALSRLLADETAAARPSRRSAARRTPPGPAARKRERR